MPQETKSAKDLPVGAEVQTFWTTWTKGDVNAWTNGLDDTMTDAEIDDLLGNGGMLTRVPVGPQAKREALARIAQKEVEMADRSIIDRAADIIEPHLTGTFKLRQRAEMNARTLSNSGLLAGGWAKPQPGVGFREQAVNVLQCQQEWRTAEKIAAELDAAGLLKGADRG